MNADYIDPAIVAGHCAGRCPSCTSSRSGYCPMWRMGMQEPSCPLYDKRTEENSDDLEGLDEVEAEALNA